MKTNIEATELWNGMESLDSCVYKMLVYSKHEPVNYENVKGH
jgi:hypothetical protein